MKRNLVNVGLVVVAAASTLVFIVTSGKVTTTEKEARQDSVLVAYREDDLTRIEIEHPGASEPRLVLERTPPDDAGDTSWQLTAPTREDAEAFAVNKLMGALEYASVVRRIQPSEVDRHAFGLDSPRMLVRLTMGSIHYVLALGKPAASPEGSAYLEVSGEGVPEPGVCIVSASLVSELSLGAGQLRGRQVMPYLSSSLSKLRLEGEGGVRTLAKVKGIIWRFDGMNGELRLAREPFDRVLLQFARTKADHFITATQARAAQSGAATVRITMTPAEPKQPKGVVVVGGACPGSPEDVVALRIEPSELAACVPGNVMPGLSTTAEELVDRALFALRADEIESLDVKRGERELALDRTGSGFLMRKPQRAPVELDAGNQRIAALLAARGALVTGRELTPAGSVTLKSVGASDDAVLTESLTVGKPDKDGNVLVRRESDGALLELDRATARALAPDASLVRRRQLLEFSREDFRRVEVTVGGAKEIVSRNDHAELVLEAPRGFAIDPGLAADLVTSLGSLTAERWVADADDGSFGLAHPALELAVSFEGGDAGSERHRLIIGAPTSGGAFARLDDDPGVFVLPKNTVEQLETLVVDRGVFLLPPETTRVTLEHGKARVVLDKRGEVFVPEGDAGRLTPDRVEALVQALSALRAEAALRLGAPAPAEGLDRPELIVTISLGRANGGAPSRRVWRIGAGDSWRDLSVFYGRVDGTSATYVIARSKVRAVIDAL